MTDAPTLPIEVVPTEQPKRAEKDSSAAARTGAPLRTLRPRTLPARWRITLWIILSTVITLIAVGLMGRSIFLAGVEETANTQIEQEAAEFARFAEDAAASGYATPEAMLTEYVVRQSVHEDEVVVASVDGEVVSVADGRVEATEPTDLSSVPGGAALISRLLGTSASSGALETSETGPLRWGRLEFTAGDREGALVIVNYTQNARSQVDASFTTIAWVALLGILLSSGVAWLVAGQILAPVREVYRVARDIGEHDLTARVPVEGTDDIAAVATTFNQMLDRLETLHTTQQRFVDDAGHELRTPITIVRGQLELLSEDPQERAETLRLVSGELDRMSRIVTDLLVLARAEQSDFVRIANCEVATLTLDIEAKAQALGDRRWQLMEIAEGSAALDPQRVTQAVLQLTANAVQVTEPGDRIDIGSRFEGEGAERRLRLWVRDTGPGVAAADAERIFERFARGDSTGVRRGSGLGLAIVRAIADGHGGSAWVDSVLGEGATFGIDIPAPAGVSNGPKTERNE
ncbi:MULTISPECIES: cell wall metabolism sensor histidine kinase WalK [unclassified Microbacterium]|uniref:sensor histidine kinase n=1 Tax=unclassified Microbacterium TaxID=2609290 RepID=UPI000EA99A3B|nr:MULTISPECIES: ATP-binding protein [unclassified Microbacterium]MBT2483313.1 HAMP domain-containing protein [Microbacterium sp. ISL-108]RKN69382.1 HAMP domain-containing protein [Microbacterium sp. CGR2]